MDKRVLLDLNLVGVMIIVFGFILSKSYFTIAAIVAIIGLVIWFLTTIYLSVNSLFNIFVETDPYIARHILAFSFVWTTGFGIYNKIRGGDFASFKADVQSLNEGRGPNRMPKVNSGGCKSCKKK